MAKWGKFDFKEFEQLKNRIESMAKGDVIGQFIEEFLLEMAFRAERKIKKRTPVGVYPKGSGRTGGQLRRNWKVGKVVREGNNYIVEIYNNTEYASFVEYGHRTGKDLRKWVEGSFMMTTSVKEIERKLPSYLEKRMTELLERLINGKPPKEGDSNDFS